MYGSLHVAENRNYTNFVSLLIFWDSAVSCWVIYHLFFCQICDMWFLIILACQTSTHL